MSSVTVNSCVVKEGEITYGISVRGPVSRFFTDLLFYVKTDRALESVPSGIRLIPLLGTLVPLSWVTDAKIEAGEVDADYLESLDRVKGRMAAAYPRLRFGGELDAIPVRLKASVNRNANRTALLYSGGIDSTATFIRRRELHPSLILVRGTPELRIGDDEYWKRVVSMLRPAVEKPGTKLSIVETSALDVVDFKSLNMELKGKVSSGWWENLSHALLLTSMCAPITYLDGIGSLLIASSHTQKTLYPWGSMPSSDEQIRWLNLRVQHDSFDLTKFDKIEKVIKPFVRAGDSFPLRVCTNRMAVLLSSPTLNCSKCAKCTRSILLLLEAGLDPSKFEFNMSSFSPTGVCDGLREGKILLEEAPATWAAILDNAGNASTLLEPKYPGLGVMFGWMSTWDRKQKASRRSFLEKKLVPKGSRRRILVRKLKGRPKRSF